MNCAFRFPSWGYPFILAVGIVVVFSPLTFRETHYKAGEVTSDFPAVMEFAQNMKQGSGDVPGFAVAHPAWELLVIAVNRIFGISVRMSAFLVTISCILAAALVLYFWLEPVMRARGLSPWLAAAAAMGLNLVTPISLLASVDRRFYFGYIGIISYHNPTIILLRPLALLQFILAIQCFRQAPSSWKLMSGAAAITLMATFAKPSFAICLLPAMGIVAACRLLKKLAVDWRLLILGFIVPAVIMLAWQFLVAYGTPAGSGIFFFPFGVMAGLSGYLGIKFLLSILFPLLVAIFFFREAALDTRMVLAWLTFLLGALYAYFLAEGPPRTFDGNFIWSAKIALLVLFCVSAVFLFEQIRAFRLKAGLVTAIWVAHVAYGAVYYYHILLTQKYR